MKYIFANKKTLIGVAITTVLLIGVITAVCATDSAAVYLGKSPRLIPIYSVETDKKEVALSFDAAWGADKTLAILDTLTEYDVVANFFAVGMWAEKYPEELKKLSESGRMEIGTHSNTHPDMGKMSEYEIKLELSASMDIIENITGTRPTLFRAPYGSYSDVLLTAAAELGLYTVQWDVDTLDWKGLSAGEIAKRVLGQVREGSIVLMHNNGEHTLEALPVILDGLKNKGFTCVKIGDLIYKDNYTIDHTGRQIRS